MGETDLANKRGLIEKSTRGIFVGKSGLIQLTYRGVRVCQKWFGRIPRVQCREIKITKEGRGQGKIGMDWSKVQNTQQTSHSKQL